jgi:tRNA-Thr(GGU) m(6)t(6)A37 methyltransferase TsaA
MEAGPTIPLKPIAYFQSAISSKGLLPHQAAYQTRGNGGRIHFTSWFCKKFGVSAWQDLSSVSHIWVLFYFHKAVGERARVLPPRSGGKKISVLATRSPYRSNHLGLSCLRLLRVSSEDLIVEGSDLLDGTPIFDIKPYVAEADRVDDSQITWLAGELRSVEFSERAKLDLARLAQIPGAPHLLPLIEDKLASGDLSARYRRIKFDPRTGRGQLAITSWRVNFRVTRSLVGATEDATAEDVEDVAAKVAAEGFKVQSEVARVIVEALLSGYTAESLGQPEDVFGDKAIHRQFLLGSGGHSAL